MPGSSTTASYAPLATAVLSLWNYWISVQHLTVLQLTNSVNGKSGPVPILDLVWPWPMPLSCGTGVSMHVTLVKSMSSALKVYLPDFNSMRQMHIGYSGSCWCILISLSCTWLALVSYFIHIMICMHTSIFSGFELRLSFQQVNIRSSHTRTIPTVSFECVHTR